MHENSVGLFQLPIPSLKEQPSHNLPAQACTCTLYRLSTVLPATFNLFIERFYLVFWPEESTYSVVPESKTVGAKEHLVGQSIQVKEGSKCFSGTVVAVGNKVDVEKRLSEMEGNKEQGIVCKYMYM